MAKVPVLAFIVCLAMQTPQPLPGQAAGTSGDRSSESKQKAKSAKNLPSQAVTFRPDNSSPDAKDKKQGLAAEDKEYSVNLASIPPVTVVQPRKDWTDHLLDWGPWVFNLLLVLVGVAAVYVAHWTRVAIEKQVSLMNRQASLMKQQADLMEKQAGIMKRQARISRKQADMQRAEFNQWIVLDGWRTAIPKDNELGISAAFVNKTHFPISKVNGFNSDFQPRCSEYPAIRIHHRARSLPFARESNGYVVEYWHHRHATRDRRRPPLRYRRVFSLPRD